ncbi:hypothetical protein [Selenomonas sp.]|uniref:hypothetical protein n=1 Tax=Selenomonas sp. TaxID=2053611 RepID=UPI001CB17FF8|nr:hypothetical protein [Selenomonas sp.]MBF1694652.1 hypothetical protein [Selenomonas sp.]
MEMYKSNDGKTFITLQAPYLTGTGRGYYAASAFCPDDAPGRDGYIPVYELRWEILPEEKYDPEYLDESCACNWDNIADYFEVSEMPESEKAEYME